MYYDIAPFILKNKIKIIPLALIVLFINLFLAELIQGNLSELFTKNAKTILILNGLLFVMYFIVRQWTYFTQDWVIYEAGRVMAPLGIIFLMLVLVISIPLVWLVGFPYDILSFVFVWGILFFAISAESKNLDDYIDFTESDEGIVLYNATIKDDLLIFTSISNKKSFIITDIKTVDMRVRQRDIVFFVTLVEEKVYDFSLSYTKMNLEVLKELIQLCKKSLVTIEDLDRQVNQVYGYLE